MNENDNSRSEDGAANAEWAKKKADKHPTETAVNRGKEDTVDRSKLAKEKALGSVNANRQGAK